LQFSFAPLLFAWDAIIVPVHFCARAIFKKKGGFFARSHLRAMGSAITLEFWRYINTSIAPRRVI